MSVETNTDIAPPAPELETGFESITTGLDELQVVDPELAGAIRLARETGRIERINPDWLSRHKEPSNARIERIRPLLGSEGDRGSYIQVQDIQTETSPFALRNVGGIFGITVLQAAEADSQTYLKAKFAVTTRGKILPVKVSSSQGEVANGGKGDPAKLRNLAISTARAISEQSQIPDTLPEEFDNADQ